MPLGKLPVEMIKVAGTLGLLHDRCVRDLQKI
jgi:hypothetical protein